MDLVCRLGIEATNDINFNLTGFDAHGCLATRLLGSAGWDNKHVRMVFSVVLPDNVLAFVQEKFSGNQERYSTTVSLEFASKISM